jgi:hypothetical protein
MRMECAFRVSAASRQGRRSGGQNAALNYHAPGNRFSRHRATPRCESLQGGDPQCRFGERRAARRSATRSANRAVTLSAGARLSHKVKRGPLTNPCRAHAAPPCVAGP